MSLAPLPRAGDVTDGRIDPHVEKLVFQTWNFETEIRFVARNIPIAQFAGGPFAELVGHFVGSVLRHPSLQKITEVIELEEHVAGFTLYRRISAKRATRVLQFRRRISRSANIARVAVLIRGFANRTNAFDETIGQKHFVVFAVKLLDLADLSVAGFPHFRVKHLSELLVLRIVG